MSYSDCIKKTGLTEDELRIFDSAIAQHQADGMSPEEAQKAAIQTRLSELETDKSEVLKKVQETEKRAIPDDDARDRRKESKARELYEDMSREELINQILKHELTGIKGRKAFVIDVQDAPVIGSIDADSLKWINDNLSPDHGDALLQSVADAIESQTDGAYHISGDEFYVLGETQAEIEGILTKVDDILSQAVITATKPDGKVITLNGLNVTYGIGDSKDVADQRLKAEKIAREERGERTGRGEQPFGAVIRDAKGNKIDRKAAKPSLLKRIFGQPDIKQPWQLTREEYETPSKLKPTEIFYIQVGQEKIEVVQNPSPSDISSMTKEAVKEYGKPGQGDPVLRFTEDANGNTYRWKAHEAIHAHIEPELSKRVDAPLNQNAANKPTHKSVVRKALYNGENVPKNIINEYPGILEEVDAIPGNKVTGKQFNQSGADQTQTEMLKEVDGIFTKPFTDPNSGAEFKTGQPVEFKYLRNTESSPNFGETYQQHIDPAGRYMTASSKSTKAMDKWETGNIKFESPLVIEWNTKENGGYDDTSWKARLSNAYGNLAGKELSQAIRDSGYDGIVTIDTGYRTDHASEIVDLTMFKQKKSEPKNLFVAHNLSAENIIAANDLGGLAAPSLATARSDISDFSGFGEVTLLADPSILKDPKARTFDADIYSPRQPRAVYDIDQDIYSELYQQLDPDNLGLSKPDIQSLEDAQGADHLLRSTAVEYHWLKLQGKEPKIKNRKVEPIIKKSDKLGLHEFDLIQDPKFIKMVADHLQKKLDALSKDGFDIRAEKMIDWYFNEDGTVKNAKLRDIASEVRRYRDSGGKDVNKLRDDVSKKLRNKKTRNEFEKWVTEQFNGMVTGKKIFKGFTPAGNRKYVAYNMQNVVKEMTQQLQAGESFFYGAGTVRSKYANEMKNIAQVKEKRNEIVAEKDMQKIKDESGEVFYEALQDLKPFYKFQSDSFAYSDDAGNAIIEGRKGLNEAFNMTPEAQQIVDDLLEYLVALPTSYFETKIQRAVGFEEFNTAIVPKGMRKDAIKILKDSGLKVKIYDPKVDGSRKDVIAKQKQVLFQPDSTKTRASIEFTDKNESIIRLTQASDLSSFLHESGHLFLEMERRFADKFGQTKDQQVLLDWLGVESFEDLTVKEHEKFAETFEVYLREGKAPSLKLREAFAAFARWLTNIYRSLIDPRLGNAELTPEIREYMDRMLATEVEIEQAMANPAYDQLFRSKEQAGMTDAEWEKYQAQATKAKNTATFDLTQKVIDEFRKRKTKEWADEKAPLVEEEITRLGELPVYKVIEAVKETPLNKKLTKEAIGIKTPTAAERFASGKDIDLKKDSLLVAAAKKGGLNMEEWSREFVDPEYLKDRAFNNQVFGRPIFKKTEGMTADGLAELANELGYAQDITANEVLELVDREISGDPVYTPQGYEALATEEADSRYGDQPEYKKKSTNIERLINRITKPGGVDPTGYAELFGYDSVIEMIEDIDSAKPIKKAAQEAAEARMIDKYGDMLNDGRIELEAREAVHNEEQAKLLIHEIKGLSKKKSPINREYLKAESKRIISGMKYKEIKPNKFYHAEIKAAQKAATATTDADKLNAKIQQIANHYMYREAVNTRDAMDKQRKQVRAYETRQYTPKTVAPSYAQNIKMLAKSYNLRKGDARKSLDIEQVVSWMITQMDDPNNYVDLTILDPNIIKMIVARQDGLPVNYELPEFDDLTSKELKGLNDQLKHMRFVGGKLSDSAKNDLMVSRQTAAESINKFAKKKIQPRHEITSAERIKDAFLEFGYSHRRIGGIFETLDGFKDGPMAQEYENITDSSNKELDLTDKMASAMNDAFKGVTKNINKFIKETITKEDGVKFTLSHRARFALALNWGNQGNRDAIIDGLNTKFPDTYTENDIVSMISTMSNQELEALNKIWTAKELLWPEMSKVEVNRKGVAPAKIEASPFVINGVNLVGGHYRLHYMKDPADSARTEITVDRAQNKSIKIGTASSMNERVGSGGRQVDLELGHLFQDLQEEIHYIAYAELSDHLNSMFKGVNNEIVDSVVKGYGEPYYDNLINTLSTLTQPEDPAQGLWKWFKYVRTNLTYGFLAGSIRNIVQQPIAITNSISQLGGPTVLKGALEFYRNPVDNWEKVSAASSFMRNRTALVNREAREQLLKIDSIHPTLGFIKLSAFAPQTFMDSLIAYPTWMGALSKYKKDHPNASEKKAIYYADEMVAKTIGSGLSKDVGSILNKSEAEKQITFMGTFFNLTWNLHVENAQLLKNGDINPMEYARRLGWMAIAPAVIAVWILDDTPEDDDEYLPHMLKEIGYYNMSSIFVVRDLASGMNGFTPSIPGLKWIDGTLRVGKEAQGLMTGDEELDANTVASILRGLQPLLPIPASGQAARTLEGAADPEQGVWGTLVEGKERNK